MSSRAVTILGSTGSVGMNALKVIGANSNRYHVYALTANKNVDVMLLQCKQFHPRYAVMADEKAAKELRQRCRDEHCKTEILSGEKALIEIAQDSGFDILLAAIVGAAGLLPTLAGIQAGKRVLLANKEALIMSGDLFVKAVKENNADLLPIDSEHNAMLQCMPKGYRPVHEKPEGVQSVILTASGGPFRTLNISELSHVTPMQALNHPNWKMGKKITVDCATMVNKGFEVAEACWLFNLNLPEIEVLIHPQSIIHSMVRYCDGSLLAELGHHDMRTPIAVSLAWPERMHSGVGPIDFLTHSRLDFSAVDHNRYPSLKLVYQAIRAGGTSMAILNAANEIAVNAFLEGQIGFMGIPSVIEQTLESVPSQGAKQLENILEADKKARCFAKKTIVSLAPLQ